MTVAINVPTDGASIAYTLDAGDGAQWLLHPHPLKLTRSATVRARAIRYGWAESAEVAQRISVPRRRVLR